MNRMAFIAAVLLAPAKSLMACQTPDNLVPNCGFPSNINGWENLTSGTCSHNGGSGSSALGNITCTSFSSVVGHVVRFRRCLLSANGVASGRVYRYGGDAQLATGSNVACNVSLADYTSDSCMNNVNSASTPLVPAAPPNYSESVPATYTVAPATVSASVQIECTSPTSFQVRVDDVFVGVEDPIFKSGFETP